MPPRQVIISSDLNGSSGTIILTDTVTATTVDVVRSGAVLQPRTLAISSQFLVGSDKDGQLLRFWSLDNLKESKVICPGKISAVSITSSGNICFVGIAEKLFVWEVASGKLLIILDHGFQQISVSKLSPDNTVIGVGSEDGVMTLWSTSVVIRAPDSATHQPNPLYTFNHHISAITDIDFGCSRLFASVGLDQKVCLYDIITGTCLFQLSFDSKLYSACMDPGDYHLYVGKESGEIEQVKLYENHVEKTITPFDLNDKECFSGHTEKVTCLSLSIDGQALISGSADSTIRVWNTRSRQCMRVISQKGPVGCLLTQLFPSNIGERNSTACIGQPSHMIVAKVFERTILDRRISKVCNLLCSTQATSKVKPDKPSPSTPSTTESKKLMEINRRLYAFCIEKDLDALITSKKMKKT